jgi:hypothetical protein
LIQQFTFAIDNIQRRRVTRAVEMRQDSKHLTLGAASGQRTKHKEYPSL